MNMSVLKDNNLIHDLALATMYTYSEYVSKESIKDSKLTKETVLKLVAEQIVGKYNANHELEEPVENVLWLKVVKLCRSDFDVLMEQAKEKFKKDSNDVFAQDLNVYTGGKLRKVPG